MKGGQVAKYNSAVMYSSNVILLFHYSNRVIQSNNDKFPVGSLLVGYLGWRTHTVFHPENIPQDFMGKVTPLPDLGSLCPSVGLGAVGMPGYASSFSVFV